MIDFLHLEHKYKKQIDKHIILLQKLQNLLEPIQFLEIFLAIIGVKISRILLSEIELLNIFPLLKESNVLLGFTQNPFHAKLDKAKGKWSSYFKTDEPTENSKGLYLAYIANDDKILKNAIENEGLGNHVEYAKFLQIPECCSRKFSDNIFMLKTKNIDPINIMIENVNNEKTLDYWCNIMGQYFGYTLLSFTPCSFNCLKASNYSKFNYNLLKYYNPTLANLFLDYHTSLYIYTETFGVYRLKSTKKSEFEFEYDNTTIDTTLKNSIILNYLLKGCLLYTS